jgi:RNA polymerase sigma-70 factor (ECF subfamily)
VAEPSDPRVRETVRNYVRAFEAADVPALVKLLTDDAIMEMPPVPLWYRGSHHYGEFMARVFRMRGPGWRVGTITANGQPALAAYAPEADGSHRLHSLQVLEIVGGRVARNVVFADPQILGIFGLPAR